MTGWLIFGGYVVGWAFCVWYVAPLIAESFTFGDSAPKFGDRIFGSVFAIFVGLVWPFALFVVALAARQRRTPRAMEREAEEQRTRIAELERELGIYRNRGNIA